MEFSFLALLKTAGILCNSRLCEKCGVSSFTASGLCGNCGNKQDSTKISIKNLLVYLLYLLIFFSALGWRIARADSETVILNGFYISQAEETTDIRIRTNGLSRPLTTLGQDNCLSIELCNARVDKTLLEKPFTSRDLRLGFVAFDEKSQSARIRLFMRFGCFGTVRRVGDNELAIRLSASKAAPAKARRRQKNLINPQEEKHSPTVLSLQDAPLVPAVLELADRAGIEIAFGDNLPEKFSAELDAPSPLEAIRRVAESSGLFLHREGKTWVLRRQNKPVSERVTAWNR